MTLAMESRREKKKKRDEVVADLTPLNVFRDTVDAGEIPLFNAALQTKLVLACISS